MTHVSASARPESTPHWDTPLYGLLSVVNAAVAMTAVVVVFFLGFEYDACGDVPAGTSCNYAAGHAALLAMVVVAIGGIVAGLVIGGVRGRRRRRRWWVPAAALALSVLTFAVAVAVMDWSIPR